MDYRRISNYYYNQVPHCMRLRRRQVIDSIVEPRRVITQRYNCSVRPVWPAVNVDKTRYSSVSNEGYSIHGIHNRRCIESNPKYVKPAPRHENYMPTHLAPPSLNIQGRSLTRRSRGIY